MKLTHLLLAGLIGLTGCSPKVIQKEVRMIELQNPILPGYFADPSLVQYDGKFYMYVTADPWGTDVSFLVGCPMISEFGRPLH